MPTTPAEARPNVLGFRVAHRAMRGDLRRLADLAERMAAGSETCTPARATALAKYVRGVCDGIHHHHDIEDRHLWPVLERAAGAEIDLTELSDDHSALDPLIDRARAAVTGFAAAPAERAAAQRLASALASLRDLLDEHIEDEERTIFPIIERHVSVTDWLTVEKAAREAGNIRFDLPRIERFAHPDELAQLHRLAGPVLRVMLAFIRPGYQRRERLIFG